MWTADDTREIAKLVEPDRADGETPFAALLGGIQDRIIDERERIADDIARTSIAQVRGLFPAKLCGRMDDQLRAASWIVSERVETDDGSWTIDLIDNAYSAIAAVIARDAFSALCLARDFITEIAELSGYGGQEVVTTRRWVNRYQAGDAIAPHEDTTGDFQLMICLDAPPTQFGGRLVLANGAAADLQRGDLLVMKHAAVVHWTTPLAEDTPTPRATATCRYYVRDGRLPHSKMLPHTAAGPRTQPTGTRL
jgi:hypothetical protein